MVRTRKPHARPRQFRPELDLMERRNLLSVALSGAAVMVTPDTLAGPTTVVVSNQVVGGVPKVDVQLNGVDHYFDPRSVSVVFFAGSGSTGPESFANNTSLVTVAYGGSGTNTFFGGSGMDEFIGGSGTNVFHAGTGFDIMLGGTGTNTYIENSEGSGIIVELGLSNTIENANSHYFVIG